MSLKQIFQNLKNQNSILYENLNEQKQIINKLNNTIRTQNEQIIKLNEQINVLNNNLSEQKEIRQLEELQINYEKIGSFIVLK